MEEKNKLKIIIIGDSQVGKTSLLFQYTENFYPENFISTVGIEYKLKEIKINEVNYTLQIWDTAGQERFKSLSRSFMNEADGVLFVYDITNKKTFQSIKDWIKIQEDASEIGNKKIIVGNKSDLEDKREISKEKLKNLCEQLNVYGEETSAKTGENVSEIFEKLAQLIVEDKTRNKTKTKNNVKLKVSDSNDKTKKKKRSFC